MRRAAWPLARTGERYFLLRTFSRSAHFSRKVKVAKKTRPPSQPSQKRSNTQSAAIKRIKVNVQGAAIRSNVQRPVARSTSAEQQRPARRSRPRGHVDGKELCQAASIQR
jgi:hypothetical protein